LLSQKKNKQTISMTHLLAERCFYAALVKAEMSQKENLWQENKTVVGID